MSEIIGNTSTAEEKIHKLNCKRNVSGELDVFEATRYFSDFIEPSPTTIQKQIIAAEHRQNRVHPETEEQLPEPIKQEEKAMTRRSSGGKLTSFLNSLLRSAGLKKSKSKLTPEVETPRGERRRRNSYVATTNAGDASPVSGVEVWRLKARRRSFDAKHVGDSNVRFCESKVQCEDRNDGDDVNGGYECDSSSESDLFELDLFAK